MSCRKFSVVKLNFDYPNKRKDETKKNTQKWMSSLIVRQILLKICIKDIISFSFGITFDNRKKWNVEHLNIMNFRLSYWVKEIFHWDSIVHIMEKFFIQIIHYVANWIIIIEFLHVWEVPTNKIESQ